VDDTRDTAFVIAAVVGGMGIGTDHASVVGIGLLLFGLVVLTSFVLGRGGETVGPAHRLTVRINPDRDPETLTNAFGICKRPPVLHGIETAKQGTALDVIYTVRMLDSGSILKLMAALRQMEGVVAVEMKPL
jgi:hypothetical protein